MMLLWRDHLKDSLSNAGYKYSVSSTGNSFILKVKNNNDDYECNFFVGSQNFEDESFINFEISNFNKWDSFVKNKDRSEVLEKINIENIRTPLGSFILSRDGKISFRLSERLVGGRSIEKEYLDYFTEFGIFSMNSFDLEVIKKENNI